MSKQDWEKNNLRSIFMKEWLWPFDPVEEDVLTILDVGCGLALKSKYLPGIIRVGVDIYPEYFKHIESDVPYVVVKHDIRELDKIFADKSFDLVIACDVVEHLEKDEALAMIKQCERIARRAVIIETPEGYIPQNMDILGHGGDEWQTHRSGWEVDEFLGMLYNVVTRRYSMSDVKRHTELDVPTEIKLIDAIKIIDG